LRFRYFINGSFSFISLTRTCPVIQGFSLSVHHLNFTTQAAQGDLATHPVSVLPMGHHPSSVKELIMAQTKVSQRKNILVVLRAP
jgi:hypothetical protein